MAALIAQESDRLSILPGKMGDVVIPEPAPTHVWIAGFRLTIATSARIAIVSDAQGMHPKRLIECILIELAKGPNTPMRARTRETKATLAGTWDLSSDTSRKGGGSRGDA